MSFEFLIIYKLRGSDSIQPILRERLREVLESNLNDVDDDVLARMLRPTFQRLQPQNSDGIQRAILGFTLELTDETSSLREVVDEFCDALIADPIEHVTKCEDPLLRVELALRSEELFLVEMKLRRVLSIIYFSAYPDADPYDLLREETVQPMSSAKPQKEQMRAASENQFFHLTFGQYVALNQRPPIKDVVSLIRNEDTYEAFRNELLRRPIEHEDDSAFVAGLKELMDSIEKMRNAVAHNRRPTQKSTNDYLTALPLVNKALDGYLDALTADWRDDESLWDAAARRAVAQAMESAEWNPGSKTLSMSDADEPKIQFEAKNQMELTHYLKGLARSAFYANCPREDGSFLFECDDDGVVERALGAYEEQIAKWDFE